MDVQLMFCRLLAGEWIKKQRLLPRLLISAVRTVFVLECETMCF
jgi:hypothetical protein